MAIYGLIFLLLFIIGAIYLQVVLSKKQSKWLGLILPALSFIYSLIAVISQFFYSQPRSSTTNSSGEVLYDTATQSTPFSELVGMGLSVFLSANIPTVLFLLIYFASRRQFSRKQQLARMTLQDLE